MAQEKQLPIIDSPRTFDIYSDELYSHQIEPSVKGGEIIASLVQYVVEHGDRNETSTMYSYAPCVPGSGVVNESPNAGDPWVIPHDPSLVSPVADVGVDAKVKA